MKLLAKPNDPDDPTVVFAFTVKCNGVKQPRDQREVITRAMRDNVMNLIGSAKQTERMGSRIFRGEGVRGGGGLLFIALKTLIAKINF